MSAIAVLLGKSEILRKTSGMISVEAIEGNEQPYIVVCLTRSHTRERSHA